MQNQADLRNIHNYVNKKPCMNLSADLYNKIQCNLPHFVSFSKTLSEAYTLYRCPLRLEIRAAIKSFLGANGSFYSQERLPPVAYKYEDIISRQFYLQYCH